MEVIDLKKHFGHYIRMLHWSTDQAVTNKLASMELTAAQGPIMGFIAHRKTAPCARDIEEEFHLSHPTVSGLLARLEKKGFIELRTDEYDRRCKRIYILPKGEQCNEMMHAAIHENEERMVQGFTEEEKELFIRFLERALQNMGGICKHKHEEE